MNETVPPVSLKSSIQNVAGVGPKLSSILGKKGVHTLEDALFFLPRLYEDRRNITPIVDLKVGQLAMLFCEVVSKRQVRRRRSFGLEVCVKDRSGVITLVWFRAYRSMLEAFIPGGKCRAFGRVTEYGERKQIVHPEYERVSELQEGKPSPSHSFGRWVPVYSETDGLYQKFIRRTVASVLQQSKEELKEYLPDSFREGLSLLPLADSFSDAHFPNNMDPEMACDVNSLRTPAIRRLIFEEFFRFQRAIRVRKKALEEGESPVIKDTKCFLPLFKASLPFALTQDQNRAVDDLLDDLAKSSPTARLVQGDVGCGKTVVAMAACAVSASAGYKSALMAPTEILAEQHYSLARRFLEPLGIQVELVVSGSLKEKAVDKVLKGQVPCVVVGTHALFQAKVEFGRLGLVVIDEQHRFGVEQRMALMKKGRTPHVVLMSATPIPRTLALSVFGDLDLSIIEEVPSGRQKIETEVLRGKDRVKLYQRIRDTVKRGNQVYIIYPLVEDSEKLDLKSATQSYEKLSREIFPELRLALLHGQLKSALKDEILRDFRDHRYDILVSTTVIEVGIDVPNATLMVIEHPERLGLSQLHQLRGRVGRGSIKSSCLLVSEVPAGKRLRIIEKTQNGFRIAEEDLKLRGPGQFLGTRQSGLPGFRVGDILRDAELFERARELALIWDKSHPPDDSKFGLALS